MKKLLFFLAIMLAGMLMPQISASFACGYVNDSTTHSAAWLNVITYYPEDIQDISTCQINPENKFCCDLLEINSDPTPGRIIQAEVFDTQTGIISNPVQTILTEEGFTVFPDQQIKKALSINFSKKVLVNTSLLNLNISSDPNYPNLKYILTNQNQTIQEDICTNCTFSNAQINLPKGYNFVKIIAYNQREIYEELDFYALDYLNFKRIVKCDGCSSDDEGYFIPGRRLINVTLQLNSSHYVEGTFSEFIPINWLTNEENLEEYSETHDKLTFKVNNSFSEFTYEVESPSLFYPRLYEFEPDFEGHTFPEIIRLTRLTIWPSILYYKKVFSRFEAYINRQIESSISPSNALVVDSDNPYLELIAIYPNENLQDTYAIVTSRKHLFWKRSQTQFRITSNIQNSQISNLLLQLKIPNNKNPSITQNKKTFTPTLTSSDDKFNYYNLNLPNKNQFTLSLKKNNKK